MQNKQYKNILISIVTMFFIGAGIPKMYAGSVLLSKRISLHMQKQTLETVFLEIEKRADVQLMFNPQLLNANRIISVDLQNTSLKEVLQSIINNSDFVFYELGQTIVITTKHKASKRNDVIPAILPADKSINQKNAVTIKTVTFFDTIRTTINDTNRISIIDTIKRYDTVKVLSALQQPTQKQNLAVPQKVKLLWFIDLSMAPLYSKLLPLGNWKGDVSFSGQMVVGVKRNNMSFSVGVGSFWQRGSSWHTSSTMTTDSVLQQDTIHKMERYRIGDFYSVKGKDTILTPMYDSSVVAIPRRWYNKTQHSNTTQLIVGYSIVWLTIPCKIEYEWPMTKKATFRLGLCVIPAFAIKTEGQLYLAKLEKAVSIASSGINSFALFASIEPSLSYALTKSFSIHFAPIIQSTVRSIMNEKAYVYSFGGSFGMRKTF